MRILCLLTSMAVLASSLSLAADKPNYPYEAIVDVDGGEDVWSGPDSKKHYPTSHLNKGDHVKVYRQDYGGWCMIAPPAGSFSWVRDINVDRTSANSGAIKTNRTIAHVGSELNPNDLTTYQAELNIGDAVEILGETTVKLPGESPRTMYKIPSPRGEWRWIKRKSILPVGATKSSPFQDNPVSPKKRGPIAEADDSVTRPISTGPVNPEESREGGAASKDPNLSEEKIELRAGKQRLHEIDQQFREMVKQDPPSWDLDTLEESYKLLDAEVDQPAMATEIGRRLESVKRHRKMHDDYVEFFKLAADAKERDAQLSTQQTLPATQAAPGGQRPAPNDSSTTGNPQPLSQPQPQGQTPAQPQPSPQAGAAPAYDGAGIVQKLSNSFPGGPQFVLIAPDGRMLCILQPTPGVDLNRYNGRTMGVIGQRYHRNDWNADVINVRSLQPVQLRGSRP